MNASTSDLSDSETWASFKNGDRGAYAVLYNNNFYRLYEYGIRFSSDGDFIKDCIQDLFVKLYTNRASLGDVTSIRNYFFSALRHIIFNKLSRAKRVVYEEDMEQGFDFEMCFPVEEALMVKEGQKQISNKINQALNALTPRQKEAIYLRYYEGLSYPEVAGVMAVTVKAVYKIIARALEYLKEHFKGVQLYFILLLQNRGISKQII